MPGVGSSANEHLQRTRFDELASHDLNLLVGLLALLEEANVTKAARRVGVSQSAMSHLLNRARAMFDDRLLVRSGGAMALTARGRNLVEPLRSALVHVSDILAEPDFDPRSARRSIVMSATSSTAFVLLPALLERLSATAPGLSLTVLPTGLLDDLFEKGKVDLALLAANVATDHTRERLYNDRWVVVSAKGDKSRGGNDLSRRIRTSPHVVFATGRERTPPYLVMAALGIPWREVLRTSDFLLVPHLIVDSTSLAFVQRRVAVKLAARFPLQIDEVPFDVPPLGIDMVWNPSLARDPMRSWLADELMFASSTEAGEDALDPGV